MHAPLSSRTTVRSLVVLITTAALTGLALSGVTAPGGTASAAAEPPTSTSFPAIVVSAPIAAPQPVVAVAVAPAKTRPTAAAPIPPSPPAVRRTTTRVAATRPVPPAFTAAEADRRGQAAFASLQRPLPAGWELKVGVHDGTISGWADAKTCVVALWVRSTDTQRKLRITLAHELGHVLDFTVMTDQDRQSYRELRGRASDRTAWYPNEGTSDFASPAGDLAEVYALWRGGAGDFRSTWATQPTTAQLDRIVVLFRDLESRQSA